MRLTLAAEINAIAEYNRNKKNEKREKRDFFPLAHPSIYQ